jgi:hypothetical protein
MADKITETNLDEFIKLVRKAVFLTSDEDKYFKAIPRAKWESIFRVNFDGNWNYAQRIILNKYKEIQTIDDPRVDGYKLQIANLDKATKMLSNAIDNKNPILYITDFDNDGSLAQAIIYEYFKADPAGAKNMHVQYAQTVNGNSNRGFTVDLVEKMVEHYGISPDAKFVVVTADNGINSVEEQMKIHARFPNAEILVTDHHNPEPEMVIQENKNAVIFNPHYKPTEFFQKFNISGATTMGVVLKNLLTQRYPTDEQQAEIGKYVQGINKLSKISNLLDYVNTHPADKPEKDYVITRFLKLQPLLNINNSISKIITGEISTEAIKAIEKKIPALDSKVLYDEAQNIHIQNDVAKILLKIYDTYKNNEQLKDTDFDVIFISELNKAENYTTSYSINPNYIEQLRPLIFSLSADDEKTAFLNVLNEKMIGVFESIKVSEKTMAEELRSGEVITKVKLDNSVIAYTDPHILSIFNRKFLNKVYNDENPGFSLTLDSIGRGKVSGSFRSLYDISDILKDKSKLEAQLNVKIETPGHERAAGFIVKSLDPENQPIDEATIAGINTFINDSIAQIKKNEATADTEHLLTDLQAITLIDRINTVVRGNVSNFDRINPLLKLTPDTIWTDSYTTEQFTMEEIVRDRKYGYITVPINFHGDTVIVPVELVRKIVEGNYEDYLSLGYMDGGVFMAEKVLKADSVKNTIDLRQNNSKQEAIIQAFEKDFKDKNYVSLNREQIKDNPFFKYHDYGELNFDLFERMVIGIIESNQVDTLAVFDVEANGFGNSKLMNVGSMNYTINSDSGVQVKEKAFLKGFFSTQRGEDYLLTDAQIKELKKISVEDKNALPLAEQKLLLVKHSLNDDEGYIYYAYPQEKMTGKNKDKLPFLHIRNFVDNEDGTFTYNREIQATMLAWLVNDNDFKVPQVMTNLTGISQEILTKYGTPTAQVDQEISQYYSGQKVLFGAHNTPYDAKVMRANAPKFYDVLLNNKLYDSALFSRELKLSYDAVQVSNFENVSGLSSSIYFYNNAYSDFNLTKFITENKNGYYPDRSNQYLLEIDNGNYFLVDKKKHEKIKLVLTPTEEEREEEMQQLLNDNFEDDGEGNLFLKKQPELFDEFESAPEVSEDEAQTTMDGLLQRMRTGGIPNTSVKFSVEKLSEQWMIHSLLLSDEAFNIQHVDIEHGGYEFLKEHKEALEFFQDNYHFDSSPQDNVAMFHYSYPDLHWDHDSAEEEEMDKFINEFLEKNKLIQQKFSDAWMYKQVLEIKDPIRTEVTNDLVDLINFQTSIPKEKIRTIFEEAIRFKEKHKISHVLQHEGHVNGPWEGDAKGDVAFEDKLTLSLLATRLYNSYTHNVDRAIREFNRFQVNARQAFERADNLSDALAQDSYSFRQGLLYDRESMTDMVKLIQSKEQKLLVNEEIQIVKFKLDNDVLPQDSAVCAISREGVNITREMIESDSQKISFIMANEQVSTSLGNVPGVIFSDNNAISASTCREQVKTILDANREKILEYKEDLSTRYKYVEYNRRDFQVKGLLKQMVEFVEGKKKLGKSKTEYIDSKGFAIVQSIFDRFCANSPDLSTDRVDAAKVHLETLRTDHETTLEKAVRENVDTTFLDFSEVRDPRFLASVEIERKEPLKRLLDSYPQLRLINEFVLQSKQNLSAEYEENMKHTRKLSM